MNTVTEEDMAYVMMQLGGTGVLHRFMSIEDAVKQSKQLLKYSSEFENADFWASTGIGEDAQGNSAQARLKALYDVGVRKFCIDVANGHSAQYISFIKETRETYPDIIIMGGNVCTYDGALRLAQAGCNAIRVGIGPGSLCQTRVVTGHGVPQLSAIEDCARIKSKSQPLHTTDGEFMGYVDKPPYADVMIIADGGIRSSGDIVKSLAIGADMVMLGGLLAGTSETPGPILSDGNGNMYKDYHGMASTKGREGWYDRAKTSFVPEGTSTQTIYKGETSEIVTQLVNSVRVGMSYAGAFSIKELREKAQWRRITNAGHYEGTAHGQKR